MTKELKDLNENQARVLNLLPEGMNNLISTTEIEDITGLSKRNVMGIIMELILDYNLAIGSFRDIHPHGYFIITNEKERILGTSSINQQIKTMQRRKETVEGADLETALLYKEKYRDEMLERDKQLDIFNTSKLIYISPELKQLLLKANSVG